MLLNAHPFIERYKVLIREYNKINILLLFQYNFIIINVDQIGRTIIRRIKNKTKQKNI